MDAAKEARKRKATSRLETSDKPFTKKLKAAQQQRHVQSASETSALSQISTPITTQPGTPTKDIRDDDDNDANYTIEIPLDDPPDTHDPNFSNNGTVEGGSVEKGSVDSQEALGEANCASCKHKLISISADKLYKTYKSPIYVFYLPPVFKIENKKWYQIFQCAAKQCITTGGHVIKRNMDSADAPSTSNSKAHVSRCFGEDAVTAASGVRNLKAARDMMKDKVTLQRSGSIAVAFELAGQKKVTYSTKPATNLEVRAHHVRWMSKSKRPFEIVGDPGYHLNMKTGRPHQYIPAPSTVARDVRQVFLDGRKLIAKHLHVSHMHNTVRHRSS